MRIIRRPSRLIRDEPLWCRRQELPYSRLSGIHVLLLTIRLSPILLMMLLVFTVPSQPTSGYWEWSLNLVSSLSRLELLSLGLSLKVSWRLSLRVLGLHLIWRSMRCRRWRWRRQSCS